MIKYLGSKRTLLPQILELASRPFGDGRRPASFLDLFSGTSRVGLGARVQGLRVISNDLSTYGRALATCYVGADSSTRTRAQEILEHLRGVAPQEGYFTETFCRRSRFFHPKNGAKIDAMREEIKRISPPRKTEAVLLTSLMEAADRVDSTCGVQMAYLKEWAPRAHHELDLRMPEVPWDSPVGDSLQGDALAVAPGLPLVDVAYLDPPYNQHSYLGNYHIWETLCLWDKPEVYGKAMKRVDCQERKSAFNSKRTAKDVLGALFPQVRAQRIILSFNDEGFLSKEEILEILDPLGQVECHSIDYRRYVGAQIGIYNPSGELVGSPKSLRNTEFLFVLERNSGATGV